MSDYSNSDGANRGQAGIVVPFRANELALYGGPPEQHGGYGYGREGLDFWGILKVLSRRRWLILTILLAGLAAAAGLTLRETPLYRGTATIEIQKQEGQIIEGSNVEPVQIADAEHMATQYALLKSRSLAERVAETLDLPSDERYADQKDTRDKRMTETLKGLSENLQIAPITRSRVVQIQYDSPYPGEAARVANAFADGFIESNLERKYNATAYARDFLEDRLKATKEALEASERKLVEYGKANNILDLSGEKASSIGDSLDASSVVALNAALSEAENERIEAEEKFKQAQTDPESLGTLDSQAITELKKQRAPLVAEYEQKLALFKPDFPEMVQLKKRIDGMDAELAGERRDIADAMGAAFAAAAARETALRERVSQLSGQLQDERTTRIDYTILQREVDTNRTQYEALLQRLKEVSIASGVGSSQVSIVDRAKKPDLPFSPNYIRAALLGLILSLAAGVGTAFALEYIDDTIKSPEDVKAKLGLPCIGVIPKAKGEDAIVEQMADPKSRIAEAFFSARTALQFSTPNGAPKCILVTGNRPAEGKTSTSLGLALSFAGLGKRVLIIDADMRRPSFAAPPKHSIGLSGLLTSDAYLQDQILQGSAPNLYLLPAGVVPPNPAELLASPRLSHLIAEAKERFDYVVVDSSPVMSFADAPLLASACDGTVLVVQAGVVRRPLIQRTIGRLLDTRASILGVVLSKYDSKHEAYGYGYGYGYKYGDTYGEVSGDDKRAALEAESARRIRIFDSGESRPDDRTWPA